MAGGEFLGLGSGSREASELLLLLVVMLLLPPLLLLAPALAGCFCL